MANLIALGVTMALLDFLMERSGYAQLLHPLITKDAIDYGSLIFHNLQCIYIVVL